MKIKFPYMEEAGDDGGAGGGGTPPAPAPIGDGGAPPAPAPNGDGGTPSSFLADLPDTWRNDVVTAAGIEGDDAKKYLNHLDRVSDLPALVKNYVNAQDKIRKGELSNGLPENPTDEQLADWRTAHDIPATADDYKVSLGEGLVLGEADERILESIYPIAHAGNVPSGVVNDMVNAFLTARQKEAEALLDQDNLHKQGTDRQLRETWGGDYQTNVNAVRGLVELLPESTRDNFMNARMADGRAVFNDPAMVVALAEWARRLNPAATVVPNANNPVKAIEDEIKELEKRMGTSEWHKDHDAQKRYMELLDAQENMRK